MIDVTKFITDHDLDKKEVAKHLFPENRYPIMAFKRILDGAALLDSEQLAKLAALAKVSIVKLFSGNWDTTSTRNMLSMESGEYRAELDMLTWTTRIFHRSSMFYEEILTQPTIPLSQYVEHISLRIAKHEFG